MLDRLAIPSECHSAKACGLQNAKSSDERRRFGLNEWEEVALTANEPALSLDPLELLDAHGEAEPSSQGRKRRLKVEADVPLVCTAAHTCEGEDLNGMNVALLVGNGVENDRDEAELWGGGREEVPGRNEGAAEWKQGPEGGLVRRGVAKGMERNGESFSVCEGEGEMEARERLGNGGRARQGGEGQLELIPELPDLITVRDRRGRGGEGVP